MSAFWRLCCVCSALLVCTVPESGNSIIRSGSAFFQTENIDGKTGNVDDTFYPLMAAPERVSATSNLTPPLINSTLG